MSNLSVKDISVVMSRASSVSTTGNVTGQADSVSFESVWNNQTEKNNTSEAAAEDRKPVRKEDDTIARDSLQAKDSHKSVVKQNENVEEAPASDLREMSPEEWEKAMEVLGAAAVEMIQQVADTFGMTVEEVQGLMTDLGMNQLDILQPEGLSQLILVAGGAQDATSLLTNEELYQQFQTLMGELNGKLEKIGDAQQVLQVAMENGDESLPIEITVDENVTVTDETNVSQAEVAVGDVTKEEQMQNPAQGEETADNKQSTEHKSQGENLMIQNIKADNANPQLQQVAQAVSTWDNETMDIMKQIMDYMKIQIKPDMSKLEMQLHPESLGTLQIQVASKGGALTAQFVTQNEAVKAVLESQMIQLKESFAEQGMKVDAVEVTVQTHQFEQNLEQGRGRQQEDTARRNRPRRIQLDGALTMEDLNTMEEEEQIAAEMMAANGNTVDYTA